MYPAGGSHSGRLVRSVLATVVVDWQLIQVATASTDAEVIQTESISESSSVHLGVGESLVQNQELKEFDDVPNEPMQLDMSVAEYLGFETVSVCIK